MPSDLNRVLLKLLHPDPNRRPRSASELVDDLKRFVTDELSTHTPLELFVGRTQETDEVIRRLENRSRPVVTAISGEAGTGKSALLRRLALEAELLGYRVVRLQCLTGRAMLEDLVRNIFAPGTAGRSLRRRYRRLLAAPPNRIEGDHRSRNALLGGLLDLVYEATEAVPGLLVVDDLQHADAFELELVSALVREIAARARAEPPVSPPLALLLSYRSESPFRMSLRPLLEALASPLAEHRTIDLGPLPVEAVQDWLRRSQSELPSSGDALSDLYDRTRGNPLALSQAIRHVMRAPEEASRVGKAAARRLLPKFSVETRCRAFAYEYQRLCDTTVSKESGVGELP